MTCHKHDWQNPEGIGCPDCLWEQSCHAGKSYPADNRNCLRLVREAVQAAVSLMPSTMARDEVIRVAKEENLWKALQVARTIRKTSLTD